MSQSREMALLTFVLLTYLSIYLENFYEDEQTNTLLNSLRTCLAMRLLLPSQNWNTNGNNESSSVVQKTEFTSKTTRRLRLLPSRTK